ncbi:MAG: twin-arginine translocase subunit TatC [Chloroflexi bacterium B3_Chlor]|nr:MAG: twin-arginine translocase subunit TatC [Chloroflexi bacterium B3_Chlor]
MSDIIWLALLAFVALIILGPQKLPEGVEALWLTLLNLRRTQQNLEPFDLEAARANWRRDKSPTYGLIQFLYSVTEHLVELRRRAIRAGLALVAATAVSVLFTSRIMALLIRPAGGLKPIFLRPTELFFTYFKVALMSGLLLALPYIIFQILAFVAPAMENPKERRHFRNLVLFGAIPGTVFFLTGVAFCYTVMLPFALRYLSSFGSDIAEPQWTIDAYITFVLTFLLGLGLVFETPLVMFVAAKLGIMSARKYVSYWRHAVVLIFLVAAVVTPTPDPVNMTLVATPLLLLYGLGIVLSRFA